MIVLGNIAKGFGSSICSCRGAGDKCVHAAAAAAENCHIDW
jgi:hypothetical protein